MYSYSSTFVTDKKNIIAHRIIAQKEANISEKRFLP